MKTIKQIGAVLLAFVVVIVVMLIFSGAPPGVWAQEYLSRKPQPAELDKVSGLSYQLEFRHPRLVVYRPGSEEQYDIVPGSNQNVMFAATSTTNVQVRLPNCTNTPGLMLEIISGINAYPKLTNIYGNLIGDYTNFLAGNAAVSYQLNSNAVARVYNTAGTGWTVVVYR